MGEGERALVARVVAANNALWCERELAVRCEATPELEPELQPEPEPQQMEEGEQAVTPKTSHVSLGTVHFGDVEQAVRFLQRLLRRRRGQEMQRKLAQVLVQARKLSSGGRNHSHKRSGYSGAVMRPSLHLFQLRTEMQYAIFDVGKMKNDDTSSVAASLASSAQSFHSV
jgi:hypothetical protein